MVITELDAGDPEATLHACGAACKGDRLGRRRRGQAEEDWARWSRKFEIARHVNNRASHFVGLELRPGAEVPPAALADS
jgi:hypothetical protein